MAKSSNYPVAVARAIIADNRKLLLMGLRADALRWEFPGGKMEHLESPEETAKRETKEECNIWAGGFSALVGNKTVKHLSKERSALEAYLAFSEFEGEPECMEKHHIDWCWFSTEYVAKRPDMFMPGTYYAVTELWPEFLARTPNWPPLPMISLGPVS